MKEKDKPPGGPGPRPAWVVLAAVLCFVLALGGWFLFSGAGEEPAQSGAAQETGTSVGAAAADAQESVKEEAGAVLEGNGPSEEGAADSAGAASKETEAIAAAVDAAAEEPESDAAAADAAEETETAATDPGEAETAAPAQSREEIAALTAEMTRLKETVSDLVQVDFVDYEDGVLRVYLVTSVDWTDPAAVVYDAAGHVFAAEVVRTERKYCEIAAAGLSDGGVYTFLLGGMAVRGSRELTAVEGYFEKPVMAAGAA